MVREKKTPDHSQGKKSEPMPSFIFMKVLESTPERYDRGIYLLSRGRINEVYEKIASTVSRKGRTILDIGCGTGNASMACASKGSTVIGIDINAGMLEVAKEKACKAGLQDRIQFLEIGVAEIKSRFRENTMDACVACLSFSELTNDEQSYAISAAYSILKPGGIFIIADEVEPRSPSKRFLHILTQAPIRLLAYMLTQSGTRPLKDLDTKLQQAEFVNIETTRIWGDSFTIIKAQRGM